MLRHETAPMAELDSVEPTPSVSAAAAAAASAFQKLTPSRARDSITIEVRDRKRQAEAEVPMEVFRMFLEVLDALARGRAVSIVPGDKELTTQQAADLLNVSRPYLVQLLEQRKIPFRRVGTRRRVRFQDLLRYKKIDDADRKRTADLLSKEAEELGLEY